MDYHQIVVLCVLAGAIVLFILEWIPLGVTGLGIIAALGLTHVLSPDDVVAALASPTVVLVGSLYVVSASLIRTGVVAAIGERLLRFGGTSELRLLVVSTLAAALFSTLLNNTSVVVLMLPILIGAAARLGLSPSRLLIPISFASILGGTTTLIGTSTNILVANLAHRAMPGEPTIGFFEFMPVGLGFVVIGTLYLWTVGRAVLPARPTVSSITRGRAFEYVTELHIPQGSGAVGMTPATLIRSAGDQVRVLQLVHGEEVLDRFSQEKRLGEGDVLVLRGPAEAILDLTRNLGLEALTGAQPGSAGELPRRQTTFAEIVITPASELVGRRLVDVRLHQQFHVLAIALQRRGAHLRSGIAHVPLRVGDTILVQGDPSDVAQLDGQPGFILLTGVEKKVTLRRRAPIAIGILGVFIVVAAARVVDLPLLAITAAFGALVTGCITLRRAVDEIDWNILALLAGSIALGAALSNTGLAAEVARFVLRFTRDLGPVAVLSAIYLLAAVSTELVSNAGAAALMLPIALATATEMQVDPRAFVFAVAYGASNSFSTPVGYQTNAFVYGPGGYRFTDFLKIGVPLQLLLWLYASLALPFFFPF